MRGIDLAAPLLSRPKLGDPQAARLLLLAVPVKQHENPAIFVDVDFLAVLAHHFGGLRSVNQRLRGDQRRLEGNIRVEQLISAGIIRLAAAARPVGLLGEGMRGAHHQIFLVFRIRRDPLDTGQPAGKHADRIALRIAAAVLCLFGFEPHVGVAVAVGRLHIFSRIVIDFHRALLIGRIRLFAGGQILAGLFEIIVVEFEFAGAEAPLRRPFVKMFLIVPRLRPRKIVYLGVAIYCLMR